MKKLLLVLFVVGIFLFSGYKVFSHFNEKDKYIGMSVVPEHRKDITLYPGLELDEQFYYMKGNHWHKIYNYYVNMLPKNGWTLDNKQVSLENNGSFYMYWTKNDHLLSIGGNWNASENETHVMFDLNPVIHTSTWINSVPDSICIYADQNAKSCRTETDPEKIDQIVAWINSEAFDKKDAPLQKTYGILDIKGEKIEVHYDSKPLSIITLKSKNGRKQMKPEELLELTGLTHLKTQ